MTFSEFELCTKNNEPTFGLTLFLKALWLDAKGDWQQAHEIIQAIETKDGSWMHAYLHRKEGDDSNASYWYNQAGKKFPVVDLTEEWKNLSIYFLEKGASKS